MISTPPTCLKGRPLFECRRSWRLLGFVVRDPMQEQETWGRGGSVQHAWVGGVREGEQQTGSHHHHIISFLSASSQVAFVVVLQKSILGASSWYPYYSTAGDAVPGYGKRLTR